MRALYQYGYEQGAKGPPWRKTLPSAVRWQRAGALPSVRIAHGRQSADGTGRHTVLMSSIGLMSPTKRSRSAMVKSPGTFDGGVGFQFLPLSQR